MELFARIPDRALARPGRTNPFLDERGKSALLLVDLAASLFGRQVY